MGAQAPAVKRAISINRAPVLTLGRAVAGLNADSKHR